MAYDTGASDVQDTALSDKFDFCFDVSSFPKVKMGKGQRHVVVVLTGALADGADFASQLAETVGSSLRNHAQNSHIILVDERGRAKTQAERNSLDVFKAAFGTVVNVEDVAPEVFRRYGGSSAGYDRLQAASLTLVATALQAQNVDYDYMIKMDVPLLLRHPHTLKDAFSVPSNADGKFVVRYRTGAASAGVNPQSRATASQSDPAPGQWSSVCYAVPKKLNTVYLLQLRGGLRKTPTVGKDRAWSMESELFRGIPESQLHVFAGGTSLE